MIGERVIWDSRKVWYVNFQHTSPGRVAALINRLNNAFEGEQPFNAAQVAVLSSTVAKLANESGALIYLAVEVLEQHHERVRILEKKQRFSKRRRPKFAIRTRPTLPNFRRRSK